MDPELSRPFYDLVPAWMLIAGTIIVFVLAGELGFRMARTRTGENDADQKSHAGVLLAALLALLGLLLAFSFSIVEARFLERKRLVMTEANAIGTTYLRAEMLPEPHRERIENLLREYVGLRIGNTDEPRNVILALRHSEVLHEALWVEAKQVAEPRPHSDSGSAAVLPQVVGLFVQSLNELIDLHQERVAVAIYHRLPAAILATLYAVAILAMGVLGYSAGLAHSRSLLPTVAVVSAVAIVITLIVELDRPWQRLFTVSQQSLADVQATMSKDY